MESEVRWHRGHTLAAGQVAEFKVWSELVRQSLGGLHVFLPMRDMGIDGVVHRLDDGVYIPVQVKARSELTLAGQVHITVTESSLVDDNAMLVATLIDGDRLGAFVLVVDQRTFRELASHNLVEGRAYLTAAFEMHSGGASRWAPHLVSRDQLAERFGAGHTPAMVEVDQADVPTLDRGREGFLGETEVVRRLATSGALNLFRPFPDLESVEVLARHVATHRFLGLQVKTAGWDTDHLENRVHIRSSSLRPSASTYLCVLSWDRAGDSFGSDCLLIPSLVLEGLARPEGQWLVLELQPGSPTHRKLDQYRTPLGSLGSVVEAKLSSGA